MDAIRCEAIRKNWKTKKGDTVYLGVDKQLWKWDQGQVVVAKRNEAPDWLEMNVKGAEKDADILRGAISNSYVARMHDQKKRDTAKTKWKSKKDEEPREPEDSSVPGMWG